MRMDSGEKKREQRGDARTPRHGRLWQPNDARESIETHAITRVVTYEALLRTCPRSREFHQRENGRLGKRRESCDKTTR